MAVEMAQHHEEIRSLIMSGSLDWTAAYDRAVKQVERDEQRLTRALALLRQVRQAGVELDDPRLSYVAVQIDRRDWDEIAALLLEE